MSVETHRLDLDGIDSSNPLAFLAALGALRTLDAVDAGTRMGWEARGGAWRPFVLTRAAGAPEQLVAVLDERLRDGAERPEFRLGSLEATNLTVTPDDYRSFIASAVAGASADDRTTVDYAAAFGSEAVADRRGKTARIGDTAFRTMSGSGHQHFLGSMRNIIEATEADHIRSSLFDVWRYADPLEKRSMRWEPSEDRRHAYQWVDPSTDPSRSRRGSMLGANRLAIEALPLFPTAPVGSRLETTGFRVRGRRVEWTWPIWGPAAPLDAVRSLLALRDLQRIGDPGAGDDHARRRMRARRERLSAAGVVEIYRSTRIAVGYFRNFSLARAV